jgi:hypothetical protein
MQLAPIDPIEAASILPMPGPAQHALAASWALSRAQFLLTPVGIPEDPPAAPDVPGARDAFQDAVHHLRLALDHAGNRPGHMEAEAALEEAELALAYLAKPGINPPIATVVEHAWRGGELAREALDHFNAAPTAWTGPA